jgi:hypothetical protein
MKINKFIHNSITNLVILGSPLRHDLFENSCVNKAIQVINHKSKKVANSFNRVTIMECNYEREYFTKYGMHLNRKAKWLVSKQLASEI